MTDTESEFVDHGRFERDGDAFRPTTNDWEASVVADEASVTIEVVVPTLNAATNEEVADVVVDGWFDTFERRVADADGVTLADDVAVESVERLDDDITVELALDPRDGKAADDALALVNYVEGTWFQGIVPGYDYREDVQELRERATQQGDETPL